MTIISPRQETAKIAADHLVGNLWFNLSAIPLLVGRLADEAMPDTPARDVYAAMVQVFRSGGTRLSAGAVESELKRKGFDFAYLTDLQRRILPEDTQALMDYAGAINDAANLRRADAIAGQMQTAARKGESSAEVVIADGLRQLTTIGTPIDGPQPIATVAAEVAEAVEKWRMGDAGDGLPTGFIDLDRIISLRDSELTVLAGRPSMGKSALAFQLAGNVARHLRNNGDGGQVVIFSAEMNKTSLVQRMACADSGVNIHRLRRRLATPEEWTKFYRANDALKVLPIEIDDTASPTSQQVFYRSAMLDAQRRVRLVVFDYLEMLGDIDQRNIVQSVGAAAKAMKNLAKRLDCPVVLLSQLSRGVEDRQDKIPALSDLRNSGDIEAAADVALFLMRPEYYIKRGERAYLAQDDHAANVCYAIVGKQRNGPVGTVALSFVEEHARFGDLVQTAPTGRANGKHPDNARRLELS